MIKLTNATKTAYASGALLSRRIALGTDGVPLADNSACRMARGSAINVAAPNATSLAAVIDTLGSDAAIVLGTLKDGVDVRHDVVTKHVWGSLTDDQRKTTITRSREYVDYASGTLHGC